MTPEALLPHHWAVGNFTDALEIIRGISFPTDAKAFEPAPDSVGCLRTKNVQSTVEWEDLWYIPDKFVRNDRQFVKPSDILISTANSLELVGKVAQVSDVKTKATIGTFICLLRPDNNMNPKFVFHQLASESFQRKIRTIASTTTNISNVSGQKLASLSLLFAPRTEQDTIVTEVEKQFTRLDAAVAALKRVQANLNRYRAAVLKAACEGRLVPTEAELARREGRSYERATELVDRISQERHPVIAVQKKLLRKNVSVRLNAEQSDAPSEPPSELTEGWCWARLGALLGEPLRNGHSAKASGEQHGVPTFTLSAVTYGDFSSENIKLTTADPRKVEDLWVQPDDIFIERSNTPELVGTARRYSGPPRVAIFPDLLIRVRLANSVAPAYIELVLQSPKTQQFFRKMAQGISGTMPKIDQNVVEQTVIPLPPSGEQLRIVAEVERRFSVIDKLRRQVEANVKRAERLRQAILKRAFEGKLVPQDPSDEPASILLERIRAEREKRGEEEKANRKSKPRSVRKKEVASI